MLYTAYTCMYDDVCVGLSHLYHIICVAIGLSNPVDTVFHLQPIMILTLLPLALFVDGQSTIQSLPQHTHTHTHTRLYKHTHTHTRICI